ncbi:transporter [Comamonas sp. NLF-1-9]|uniref:transporter n=1 Tax=Comamonas sp. NLF-1-9 TaxID=2853163 RepID=UPI001C48C2C2|nr:transporter [Comamonas sp. NLF-1-9]QXL84287.1 transporter [Comamonas sp. NLF-1-9]
MIDVIMVTRGVGGCKRRPGWRIARVWCRPSNRTMVRADLIRFRAGVLAVSLLAASLAAQAAHPLLTDDTGTQGAGRWQLELNTDHTRARADGQSAWQKAVGTTLTHGVSDALDVAVSAPWLQVSEPGEARVRGLGDTTVQAKWRFFENDEGWSLGLRPALVLPSGSASKGLGNGRASASVALISTLERGDWTWLANAGYTWNNNRVGDRRHLWALSSAVLYAASAQWSLALDVGISRSADQGVGHDKYGLIGAIFHAGKDVDLDLGWRRSLGGGPVVHTLGAGVTVRW